MAGRNRLEAALRWGVYASALLLAACSAGSADRSGVGSTRAATSVVEPAEPSGLTTAAAVPPPPLVFARALQIRADGTGQHHRVDAPVEWVQTTLSTVWQLAGFRSAGKSTQQVYVVELHGRFCCHPGPPGHDPFATSVFDVLPVDGLPGDSLGGGTSSVHPLDLAKLGTVRAFTLP